MPISTIIPTMLPSGVTLSNGNMTFTNTTAFDKSIPTTPILKSGKWYWEVTNGATYSVNTVRMVGVGNMYHNGSTFLGSTNNNIGYNGAGQVAYNNAGIATIQTYAANSVICIALDLVNNTIYFRVGAGLWNNSAVADPDTNVGGIAISIPAGVFLRPMLGCNTVGNSATINFGDTAFVNGQPMTFASVNTWDYPTDLGIRNATMYQNETGSTNYATASAHNGQVDKKSSYGATQALPVYSAFYGDRRPYSPPKTETFVAGRTFISGVLTPNCDIYVIDPTTGELLNRQKSDEIGEYKLSAMGRPKVTVVGKQAGPNYNAMVFADVVPVNLGPVKGAMSRVVPITSTIRVNVIYPSIQLAPLTYTGTTQRYMIPNDNSIGSLSVSMWGGGGAGGIYTTGGNGGGGGFTTVTIPVEPFDIIDIQVGQGGRKSVGGQGGVGGWPDGGGGGLGDTLCGGGGGSSRIWKNDQLVAVAGAGGGGSGYSVGEAGAGGGSSGQSSSGAGGTGGSQTAGGFDSNDPNPVKTGLQIINFTNRTGGWGANTGNISSGTGDDGGGGGGGYWGGGGGGGDGQSGGGGSGYIAPTLVGSTSAGNYLSAAATTDRVYPGSAYAQGGLSLGGPTQDGGNGYVMLSNAANLAVTEQSDSLDFVGDLLSIPQTWRFVSGDGLTASNSNTRLTLTQFYQAWFKANSGTTRRASDANWFYEVKVTENNPQGTLAIGIAPPGVGTSTGGNAGSSGRIQYFNTGQTRINGGYSNYGPSFTSGDKIGCSIENSAGNTLLRFYKNGIDLGVAYNLGTTITSFYEPHFCLYANQGDSICILDIEDTTNLPAGFSIW